MINTERHPRCPTRRSARNSHSLTEYRFVYWRRNYSAGHLQL